MAAAQILLARGDKAEYEARREAIRAAGDPVEFADLNEEIPDEENGFLPMREACRILEERGVLDAYFIVDSIDGEVKEKRFDLAEYADCLELLQEAARRPRYGAGAWAPNPNTRAMFQSAGLQFRISAFLSWAIRSGPLERAADLVRLKLALAERCEDPFLIGRLVEFSAMSAIITDLQKLRERPGFDAVAFRRAVDPDIARAAATPGPPRRAFAQERVTGIWRVERWIAGDDLGGFGGSWKDEWRHTWLGRRMVYRDAIAYLDLMQSAIEQCPTGAREVLTVAARIEATEIDEDHTMTRRIRPVIALMLRNYTVMIANLRMLRVAMAILEFRQVEGRWPDRLDELRFDDAMPRNPFTDAPFEYERTGEGARMRYPSIEAYWIF